MLFRTTLCVLVCLAGVGALAATNPGGLSLDMVQRIQASYDKSGDHSVEVNAITNNDIKALSLNRDRLMNRDKIFNVKVTAAGITNQQSSGRCWLFSALNSLAPSVMTKLHAADFQFSQPYLTFWDKMEKANLFLENIIATADLPLGDRKVDILLTSPFGDGGWWDYVVELMNKYGAAPISAMPETKQSVNTGTVNALAETKLRAFAVELRSMHQNKKSIADLRTRKEAMLADIYRLLSFTYGEPPKEFTLRYEAKDSSITAGKKYTPLAFYKEFVEGAVPRYVVLMNNPAKDYDRAYQVENSRNIYEQPDITMLNIPVDRLKAYCLKALLDSQMVVFACDVGAEHMGDSALLATGIYAYDKLFGIDFKLTKAQRIELRQSTPNHSMVFVGVDTAGGRPTKWLVENSWGASRGDKGYWYMDDDWFNEYVYVVVIDRKHISESDLALLEKKPVAVPIWDPFAAALRQHIQ